MKLSPEVKKAVEECKPALIATASKSGKPNVSAKGTFQFLDDEHVLFADIRSPRTVANLKENPQISVIAIKQGERTGYRIWGKAEVLASGPLFDQIVKQQAAQNRKPNHVVKITVEDALVF